MFSLLQEGVKIFSEETIYHLGDRYVEYIKDYKKKKQDEFRSVAVFPVRLKIIPTVSVAVEVVGKNGKIVRINTNCKLMLPFGMG